MDLIRKYFPSHEVVAAYEDEKIAEILGDEKMIRNRRKIQFRVGNARTFQGIIGQYGSFEKYIESSAPA